MLRPLPGRRLETQRMATTKTAKQAARTQKAGAKSATRSLKDLASRDTAKVKGGAKRRIVPCV